MAQSFVKITITSTANAFQSDRTFPLSTTVQELKGKLELLTGVPASQMQLEIRSAEGKFLSTIPNSGSNNLSSLNVQNGMIIHHEDLLLTLFFHFRVIGSADATIASDDAVEKFVISDEDYNKRADSVRAWKQKQQLAEYNPEYEEKKRSEQEKKDLEAEELAKSIKVGQRCEVHLSNQPTKRGTVMFVGTTDFKPGHWIGVRYDEPVGKHDGSVNGRQYFQCPQKYGSFVKPQDVTVGNFPEQNVADMDEF